MELDVEGRALLSSSVHTCLLEGVRASSVTAAAIMQVCAVIGCTRFTGNVVPLFYALEDVPSGHQRRGGVPSNPGVSHSDGG